MDANSSFSLIFSGSLNENTNEKGELFLHQRISDRFADPESLHEWMSEPSDIYEYDGDGMTDHRYKRYLYTVDNGSMVIGTHYYEVDSAEFIDYLWTDAIGAGRTDTGIAVGSSEAEVLDAYTGTQALYLLSKEELPDDEGLTMFDYIYDYDSLMYKEDRYDFDCAYFYQPFTPETNDIRDIHFYIKDGVVAAVEMMYPFELRNVYGYDSEAGLVK